MLAALWRENPTSHLSPGQRLMTMAALMHIDRDGAALLPALIRSSGVSIDTWLRRYLECYLCPLVHCFYAYHLVFTPHCENTILVLKDNVPVGVVIKDIAEDIGVLNPELELPESVRRLALRVPEETMTLAIFTDVFDCVFRFLARILHEHTGYPEERFWRRVAESIQRYEHEQPQLGAKFRRYDLFAPTFIRNCLNRLQLRNNRLMVDLNAAEPVDSLQFVGKLRNPIAPFGRRDEALSSRREPHGIA
jgi:siderophore synthetase component